MEIVINGNRALVQEERAILNATLTGFDGYDFNINEFHVCEDCGFRGTKEEVDDCIKAHEEVDEHFPDGVPTPP